LRLRWASWAELGGVLPSRLNRLAAPAAVVAGAALLGVSVGGLTSVDGELRAAAAPVPATTELVVLRHDRAGPGLGGRCDHDRLRDRPADAPLHGVRPL
jgi:hypothetical protein